MKFRKKPVVIDAEQFFPDKKPWPAGVNLRSLVINGYTQPDEYFIETLEGNHIVTPRDWIITGVKGERYACKPDIFEMTYEDDKIRDKLIKIGKQDLIDIRNILSATRHQIDRNLDLVDNLLKYGGVINESKNID
jgi:hypothetical protein